MYYSLFIQKIIGFIPNEIIFWEVIEKYSDKLPLEVVLVCEAACSSTRSEALLPSSVLWVFASVSTVTKWLSCWRLVVETSMKILSSKILSMRKIDWSDCQVGLDPSGSASTAFNISRKRPNLLSCQLGKVLDLNEII